MGGRGGRGEGEGEEGRGRRRVEGVELRDDVRTCITTLAKSYGESQGGWADLSIPSARRALLSDACSFASCRGREMGHGVRGAGFQLELDIYSTGDEC